MDNHKINHENEPILVDVNGLKMNVKPLILLFTESNKFDEITPGMFEVLKQNMLQDIFKSLNFLNVSCHTDDENTWRDEKVTLNEILFKLYSTISNIKTL